MLLWLAFARTGSSISVAVVTMMLPLKSTRTLSGQSVTVLTGASA
jgi:hypothetical protein